jgi:chromosome segregation ATPase
LKKNRDNDAAETNGNEESEILARLSERVERAVSMIQELRRERDQLRGRVEELEERLKDADDTAGRVDSLEKERGEIRNRIESILANLERLEE